MMHKIYMVMSQNQTLLMSLDISMVRLHEETWRHVKGGEKTKWKFEAATPFVGNAMPCLALYSSEKQAKEVMGALVNYCNLRDADDVKMPSVFLFPEDNADVCEEIS